jgi:hypothetical protein
MIVADTLFYFALVAIAVEFWFYLFKKDDPRWIIWGVVANVFVGLCDLISAIIAAMHGQWGAAGGDFLAFGIAVFCIWWLLRRWKDRKKVMALLGAKTRALRDKVVKRMKETTVPSPVRIPA